MRQMLCLALLWAGCDDFEPRTVPPDPEAEVACEPGLSRAADASLIGSQFAVNGLELITQLNQGGVYDGVPAVCANDDGTELRLIFEVAGTPYGEVSLSHFGPGSYDANVQDAVLTLDLFGADVPVVYGPGDWQTASWSVGTREAYVTSDFFGTGFVGDQQVAINIQLAVSP